MNNSLWASKSVRQLVKEFGHTTYIKAWGEEAQAIRRQVGLTACRRVLERTHSWMNRLRHILMFWEKKPENTWVGFIWFCATLAG